MAKVQEKTSFKDMSAADLKVQLAEFEEKLYKLKFRHSVSPIKNPLEIRGLRRDKARILTWIRQKELAPQAQPAAKVAKTAPKTAKAKKK